MTDIEMQVMQLGGKGYSCAQIVLQTALEYLGRDNLDLIRAAAGLARGGGCSGELCGALSGGLCLLGLYVGKGQDSELPDPSEQLVYSELVEWFRSEHAVNNKITCAAILGLDEGQARAMNPEICENIVASTIAVADGLLIAHGFDPNSGREV